MTLPPRVPSFATFLIAMGLDPATSEALCQRLPRLSLMADQRLLAQGDGQEVAFYIEQGIAWACHYTQDGQDPCKEFYF